GIRCEKASAYIRNAVPQNKGIYHLKGGIHKYLEEFGHDALSSKKENDDGSGNKEMSDDSKCLFVGKNFVFDRRGALDAKGHGMMGEKTFDKNDSSSSQVKSGNSEIIGKCQNCSCPYDTFHPENVCTVCREPVLICEKCQSSLYDKQRSLRQLAPSTKNKDDSESKGDCRAEYHCDDHFHLKSCYYTSLHGFAGDELGKQLEELQMHSKELEGIGKKGKQKRRTLRKQMDKISCMKNKLSNGKDGNAESEPVVQCRHCGASTCESDCWGFHGGNTRMVNKSKKNPGVKGAVDNGNEIKNHKQRTRVPSNQRPAKRLKRENDLAEIDVLQLSNTPCQHRNDATGMRIPPPVVRILRSGVKGKWCGKTVAWVMSNAFGECSHSLAQKERDDRLEQLIGAGMIRINGVPAKASNVVLRNMDTIERIVHWHEPPISVPSKIPMTQHTLPESILASNGEATGRSLLYCINKPPSVPIYPAGPYYANSLLIMVEAQEGLPPKTLIPLHRIDRATSGVLLCTNNVGVARFIQGKMSKSGKDDTVPIKKLYLARVKGKFPAASSESPSIPKECASIASFVWCGDKNNTIEVNAPIAVELGSENKFNDSEDGSPSNTMMHRTVRSDGKHSISRFQLISYDPTTDQSLVACCPITGRGHQLRVHLQLTGFPIHNDVEYGGTVNTENRKEQENLSAQCMLDVAVATTECRREKAVTADEVKHAVELCRCCSGGLNGIKASFNSAQLLGCGHAIDLHAHKYCIPFEQKNMGKSKDERSLESSCDKIEHEDETSTSMEFTTDLPSWAASFGGLMPSNSLTWLH
ncbi:hypothetical protein ACHAXR_006170, partial [Thalassiosira sp. AJA248-18]